MAGYVWRRKDSNVSSVSTPKFKWRAKPDQDSLLSKQDFLRDAKNIQTHDAIIFHQDRPSNPLNAALRDKKTLKPLKILSPIDAAMLDVPDLPPFALAMSPVSENEVEDVKELEASDVEAEVLSPEDWWKEQAINRLQKCLDAKKVSIQNADEKRDFDRYCAQYKQTDFPWMPYDQKVEALTFLCRYATKEGILELERLHLRRPCAFDSKVPIRYSIENEGGLEEDDVDDPTNRIFEWYAPKDGILLDEKEIPDVLSPEHWIDAKGLRTWDNLTLAGKITYASKVNTDLVQTAKCPRHFSIVLDWESQHEKIWEVRTASSYDSLDQLKLARYQIRYQFGCGNVHIHLSFCPPPTGSSAAESFSRILCQLNALIMLDFMASDIEGFCLISTSFYTQQNISLEKPDYCTKYHGLGWRDGEVAYQNRELQGLEMRLLRSAEDPDQCFSDQMAMLNFLSDLTVTGAYELCMGQKIPFLFLPKKDNLSRLLLEAFPDEKLNQDALAQFIDGIKFISDNERSICISYLNYGKPDDRLGIAFIPWEQADFFPRSDPKAETRLIELRTQAHQGVIAAYKKWKQEAEHESAAIYEKYGVEVHQCLETFAKELLAICGPIPRYLERIQRRFSASTQESP